MKKRIRILDIILLILLLLALAVWLLPSPEPHSAGTQAPRQENGGGETIPAEPAD